MVEERQKLVKEKEELGAKFKETEQILRSDLFSMDYLSLDDYATFFN